jgi:hypothetical protein
MDSNFVLMKNDGKIMAGGYIINDRLLIPSMSGGKKNDDENSTKEKKYAIPAGLFYIDVPYEESSVEIIYKNNDVLSDDIYDNLYDNVTFTKSTNELITKNKKKNKNTKRRKISTNSSNKISRKKK